MTGPPADEAAWAPPRQPAADADALLAGYRDFVVVARGGDSVVYRAHQDALDRDVAVKVVLLDDPESIARFRRELTITVRLGRQHPNIMTVLATGTTTDGQPCLVMDYVELGSLHNRLTERGPLPVSEVVAAGSVVADALAFAHEQGVLHRDVKPQNVLVLPTSYVLADFGLARAIDAGHSSSLERFSYRHASPQILDGEPPTVADDVYSLGSTLFTLLDGRPPFAADDPDEDSALAYLRRARTEAPRLLRRDDLPPRLADIVMRCLAHERSARFRTAAQLRDALYAIPTESRSWAPPAAPPPVAAAEAVTERPVKAPAELPTDLPIDVASEVPGEVTPVAPATSVAPATPATADTPAAPATPVAADTPVAAAPGGAPPPTAPIVPTPPVPPAQPAARGPGVPLEASPAYLAYMASRPEDATGPVDALLDAGSDPLAAPPPPPRAIPRSAPPALPSVVADAAPSLGYSYFKPEARPGRHSAEAAPSVAAPPPGHSGERTQPSEPDPLAVSALAHLGQPGAAARDAESTGLRPIETPPEVPAAPAAPGRRRWLIIATIGVVALGGGIAVGVLRSGGSSTPRAITSPPTSSPGTLQPLQTFSGSPSQAISKLRLDPTIRPTIRIMRRQSGGIFLQWADPTKGHGGYVVQAGPTKQLSAGPGVPPQQGATSIIIPAPATGPYCAQVTVFTAVQTYAQSPVTCIS